MTLQLGPIPNEKDVPTCTPYLMPFHINYSGQAPISTFLRVEAASETVGAPSRQETASKDDSTKVANASFGPQEMSGEAPTDVQDKVALPPPPTLVRRVADATTRLISTFRGRTIQGLKVELPAGYGGLVLRVKDDTHKMWTDKEGKADGKTKGKAKVINASKGRFTRSAARVEIVDGEDMNAMEVDDEVKLRGGDSELPDESPIRSLIPSSQFSSFVLWHPDNQVDEGRDEYFRSLTEWIQLAHEIHKVQS